MRGSSKCSHNNALAITSVSDQLPGAFRINSTNGTSYFSAPKHPNKGSQVKHQGKYGQSRLRIPRNMHPLRTLTPHTGWPLRRLMPCCHRSPSVELEVHNFELTVRVTQTDAPRWARPRRHECKSGLRPILIACPSDRCRMQPKLVSAARQEAVNISATVNGQPRPIRNQPACLCLRCARNSLHIARRVRALHCQTRGPEEPSFATRRPPTALAAATGRHPRIPAITSSCRDSAGPQHRSQLGRVTRRRGRLRFHTEVPFRLLDTYIVALRHLPVRKPNRRRLL